MESKLSYPSSELQKHGKVVHLRGQDQLNVVACRRYNIKNAKYKAYDKQTGIDRIAPY